MTERDPLYLTINAGMALIVGLILGAVLSPCSPASARARAPEAYRALERASARTGVPLKLLRAVAWTESRFNPKAVSPRGAKGLLQLMPVVLRTHNVADPFDPNENALVGAKVLRNQKKAFGRWRPALAAFNWGPGNVRSGKRWPSAVRKYVRTVCERSGVCAR